MVDHYTEPRESLAEAELKHVLWLCHLLRDRGYDLHSLAHILEPLSGDEYERRYGDD